MKALHWPLTNESLTFPNDQWQLYISSWPMTFLHFQLTNEWSAFPNDQWQLCISIWPMRAIQTMRELSFINTNASSVFIVDQWELCNSLLLMRESIVSKKYLRKYCLSWSIKNILILNNNQYKNVTWKF